MYASQAQAAAEVTVSKKGLINIYTALIIIINFVPYKVMAIKYFIPSSCMCTASLYIFHN